MKSRSKRRSKVSRRSSRGAKAGKESTKANPRLWESIKKKVMSGSKGGPKGRWSARKAQLLVAQYKAKGGKFKGKKSSRNSLSKWSREKWDYISKSGRKSKRGRYLPEKVRRSLTPAEKRRENKKKGSKRGKNVKYSRSVNKKMKKYKIY